MHNNGVSDSRGHTADYSARLLAAAQVARAALEGGRSDRLLRLFNHLLDRTLAGESPSEQEIAQKAFGDDGFTGNGQDANVRVYVYRLRKALDAAFAGTAGPKLHIPLGEYRIRLVGDEMGDGWDAAGTGVEAPGRAVSRRRYLRIAALIAAALAIALLGWSWPGRTPPPLAQTLAWESLYQNDRPLIIVVGDYYLFAKLDTLAKAPGAPPQLVWDKAVPTREDLTILQILSPATADTVVDYNQQFVSGGTIEALSDIRADFSRLPGLRRRALKLVAASQLTPEMLKSSDIIYIGQFSGMSALLRDPLAQASAFRINPGFDGLTDKSSATRYQSDGMVLTDERIARRDFAYLASLPGPSGNRLLVIAGLGDAGVKEAAQMAGDLQQMTRLTLDPGLRRNGFEALYRVRTIKEVNVGATLIVNRPLRSGGIWDNAGNVPAYHPIDSRPPPAEKP
jgi:hypothetical protein